jgi:hypothetical protein
MILGAVVVQHHAEGALSRPSLWRDRATAVEDSAPPQRSQCLRARRRRLLVVR